MGGRQEGAGEAWENTKEVANQVMGSELVAGAADWWNKYGGYVGLAAAGLCIIISAAPAPGWH